MVSRNVSSSIPAVTWLSPSSQLRPTWGFPRWKRSGHGSSHLLPEPRQLLPQEEQVLPGILLLRPRGPEQGHVPGHS